MTNILKMIQHLQSNLKKGRPVEDTPPLSLPVPVKSAVASPPPPLLPSYSLSRGRQRRTMPSSSSSSSPSLLSSSWLQPKDPIDGNDRYGKLMSRFQPCQVRVINNQIVCRQSLALLHSKKACTSSSSSYYLHSPHIYIHTHQMDIPLASLAGPSSMFLESIMRMPRRASMSTISSSSSFSSSYAGVHIPYLASSAASFPLSCPPPINTIIHTYSSH